MPLQKSLIDLPLTGGINQKEDAIITQRPTQLSNCLYRKSGVLSKRYGFTCVGTYNKYIDGSTPPVAELITTLKDELVRVGGGQISTYATINSASDWIYKGKISNAYMQVSDVDVSEDIFDPDMAVNGNYCATIFRMYDSAEAKYKLFIKVINSSTEEVILTKTLIQTSTTDLSKCRVVAIGSYFFFFFSHSNGGGDYTIKYFTYNTTTTSVSAVSNIHTACANAFDVAVYETSLYITYFPNGLLDEVYVDKYVISAASLPAVSWSTPTVMTTSPTSLAITATSTNVFIGWAWTSGAYTSVRTALFTSSGTPVGECSVLSAGWYTGNYCSSITVSTTSTSDFLVAWTRVDMGITPRRYYGVYWNKVASNGVSKVWGIDRVNWYTRSISRIFLHNSRNYMWVINKHSTHATAFLVDMQANETVDCFRLVGIAAPRQIVFGINYHSDGHLSQVVNVSGNKWITSSARAGNPNKSLLLIKVDFEMRFRMATEAQEVLALTGGNPSIYDKEMATEIGFANEPDIALTSNTNGNVGALTSSAKYFYRFIYEWWDAMGNKHRSAPSNVYTVSLGAAENSVFLSIPCLTLTNKTTALDSTRKVFIRAYRTKANGATFYRVPIDPLVSEVSSQFVNWTDTAPDSMIEVEETLYTTGGVLDNVMPSSATIIHTHKNAVFLAGTEDDSIWISKALVLGDGLAFNDSLVIPPFEGGKVIGLATLDSNLVIFKTSGIWLISGEPPNDLGDSTLSDPQRIHSDIGCSDVRTIVSTPDGIMFYAGSRQTGIYLLSRGLEVIPVGKNIEDLTVSGFAGAVLLPKQNLIRFVQYQQNGTKVAWNYDYYHSKQMQTAVWSTDDWNDPATGSPEVRSCCVWKNEFYWIGGSAGGTLYKEDSNSYLDVSGATTNWIAMSFTTAFEKSTGIQGFHRVWRAGILGYKNSDHGLSITLTSDLGTQTKTWTNTEINALTGLPNENIVIHSQYQKVNRMSVKVSDTDPISNRGSGAGLTLKGITLELGLKSGLNKISATNRK